MKMYDTPHALSDYLDQVFTCDCGHTHSAPLKYVSIRSGAIRDLPEILDKLGKKRPFLICDSITRGIAGDQCMEILAKAGMDAKLHQLTHLGFDEATLGELVINMPLDYDIAVAVGTGAINDMTRFFSFQTGRPFCTVATAAPMDGFASNVAVLNINNFKTTIGTQMPLAILGDTDILKEAPYPMIAAGLGDLLGKCNCLCDWRLANIIIGEHRCEKIIDLVNACLNTVLEGAAGAKARDAKVIGDIMTGLVLSGVAMSLYGTPRPASGCEHHMSHYWDTVLHQQGRRGAPHGTQVGVGTVMVLKAAEELLRRDVDFDAARKAAPNYDPVAWEEKIRAAYGDAAQDIIDMERQSGKNEPAGRLKRIDVIEANWDAITDLLRALPSSAHIMDLLKGLEAAYLPEQIGVDKAMLKDTFMYCKEIRTRYTLLQMLWDLELLDSVSDAVIASL